MVDLNDDAFGRFGNQLFKFFFLKIVQKEFNCEIQYPDWLGNIAFNIPSKNITILAEDTIIIPAINDYSLSNVLELIRQKNNSGAHTIVLRGFFQFHTREYLKYKDLFYDTFQPNDFLFNQIEFMLDKIDINNTISIHIRRGDYLNYDNNNLFWVTSMQSIFESLEDIKISTKGESLVYICSDDLKYCTSEFLNKNISHITCNNLFHYQEESVKILVDFILMTISNVNIISNSSFSFFASMLNKKSKIFLRPSPVKNILIPYDPWNSPILLSKNLN